MEQESVLVRRGRLTRPRHTEQALDPDREPRRGPALPCSTTLNQRSRSDKPTPLRRLRRDIRPFPSGATHSRRPTPGCDVAYVDTSRNGRRRFCSTRCSNRVYVADHRRRHP
ncbi:CGNR zinc finger domain-containing protein [Streptosporangium canum]|uniref:CGNR zinc finger domain-containing protein n=1 Tax=Streptosporangium canum TaxID=324952 RepID=UPI001C436744|nr:CGNR zinc finger domain-containing protein [Streptosporangium canum]